MTVLDSTDGNTISNARIFVGHYEARVSPIGDTNPATVGANLNDVADFAPGTYELLAQAPGYGFLRGERTFRRGANSMIEFRMPTNHASITNGATAAGDSNVVSPDQAVAQPGRPAVTPQQVLNMLIDDTERTNWTAAGDITPASPGNLSVAGKQVTVDLAGTKAATIRHIQVSSMLRSGRRTPGADERLSEPLHGAASVRGVGVRRRQGRLQHQRRVRPTCTPAATTPSRAIPPRPVAPHMILREFDIPKVKATHLRLVAVTSQCTGGPAFQGEQDADPTFTTDCDSNVATGASRSFVRAAEFQAFSEEGSVRHR